MTLRPPIRYLKHPAIDKVRWDAALRRSANGVIYAQSAFLDHMCPGWEALITGDYDAIFPLPGRSKAGIRYLYQPFLTAQLGLFSERPDAAQLQAFLEAIPSSFRYLDFPLNAGNLFEGAGGVFPLFRRANYVLDLAPGYEHLRRGYRENIRRNIRKALQLGCRTEEETPLHEIASLAQTHAQDEAGMAAFGRLFALLQARGEAKTYGIRSAQGQLLASAVFLLDNRRAYYLLVGNHPNGRTIGASHLLIDTFIRAHAGRRLLLDFEGSDFRNLAFFYSSFGAREEPYAALRLNRLPWWARWLKKP